MKFIKQTIGAFLLAIQIFTIFLLFPIGDMMDTIRKWITAPKYYTIAYLNLQDHAAMGIIAAFEIGLAAWIFGWWAFLLIPLVFLVYFVPAVEKWWNSMIEWAHSK